MAKTRTRWRCQECGATAARWIGRCSDCGEFGTYVEEVEQRESGGASPTTAVRPIPLSEAGASEQPRVPTGVEEFDRVLGGGFVRGSLVLIGGEPGIGKSTLLLQASDALARQGESVLYACGEESPAQIGMRATRLGATSDNITLLPEVNVVALEASAQSSAPGLLVVDSIQTMFDPDLTGAPGSVGQVRACTARLMRLAKDQGITTVIVGHVTKDGAIAGPRVLEHMVDAVLYFEGDRDHAFRVVRAVKNRFGSASEIGIFEMGERGLAGVGNPAAVFLGERDAATPGSTVMAAMEGSRPLLVEVQALVTPTYLTVPRRLATGIDTTRLLQVLAVLERHAGVSFAGHDVYVSIAGGVRVVEPAVDVPLALALLSALRATPVPTDVIGFGEIGLTGRLRSVAHAEPRMREAGRQGLTRVAAKLPSSVTLPEGSASLNIQTASELNALLS